MSTLANTPVVLGMGHRARQGKDEAAKTIMRERGGSYRIAAIALADALRAEVNHACESRINRGYAASYQEALQHLCHMWTVPFDPNAVADDVYEHGKQRALLQAIGQGRREGDPAYWLKQWKQVVLASDAEVVLVTDVRYPNEMEAIKELNGVTIKFTRLGYSGLSPEAAAHISETVLDTATFDHEITVNDGELDLLRRKALDLFDHIVINRKEGQSIS